GARACPEGDVLRYFGGAILAGTTGSGDDLNGVFHQGRVDVDRVRFLLHGDEAFGGDDLARLVHAAGHPVDDYHLFPIGRVVHEDFEHEAVDLGFRKSVGALGLDWVLGGEHEKGLGDMVSLAADRDLMLLHYLEESGLDLSRGPVDLVGEEEVREY